MIIKCPECGKEISDKSKQCIHCGYPLINNENNENSCMINNIKYDLNEELQMVLNNIGTANVIRALRMKCGISLNDAKRLYDIINETKLIPNFFQCDIVEAVILQSNKPKCPICQSTNLSKITTTKKAMKIAAFGIFGMEDNGKTWKCNDCGSKF